MLSVPFEVVPSAVSTLLPAFLQVLKAGGECLFQNACEFHRRSRLNILDSHVAVLLAFFPVVETEKKSHGERSGEYGGCGNTVTLCLVINLATLFKSDVHSSNSNKRHWQGTRGFPPRPAA
jgi:hypothetical protein